MGSQWTYSSGEHMIGDSQVHGPAIVGRIHISYAKNLDIHKNLSNKTTTGYIIDCYLNIIINNAPFPFPVHSHILSIPYIIHSISANHSQKKSLDTHIQNKHMKIYIAKCIIYIHMVISLKISAG